MTEKMVKLTILRKRKGETGPELYLRQQASFRRELAAARKINESDRLTGFRTERKASPIKKKK